MRTARQLHLFLGLFFAPSIIFFAFSGFLQTYSLHEEHEGKQPEPWMATLGEIHKNQRIPLRPQGTPAPAPTSAPSSGPASQAASPAAGPTQGSAAVVSPAPGAQAGSAPGASAQSNAPARPRPQRRKKSVPLKVFMGFMATGLILTTLLGIYMSFKITRRPVLSWGLLAAGVIIPVVALYVGM